MQYALLIAGDHEPTPEELAMGCGGWSEEMAARGVVRGGAGLRPPAESTTVRVRDGQVLLTDGPFADTKEQIGGLVLIECADLDEAVEIAARHPAAGYGMIEIRPLFTP
ncbi:YciI family protein [Kutzneria sp. NPDC052558]|uniref:YciI family protein n=1 Tax=Kutzneria sp. NPDC052558 TaxID=3364121 RepID=UPI0037CA7639